MKAICGDGDKDGSPPAFVASEQSDRPPADISDDKMNTRTD